MTTARRRDRISAWQTDGIVMASLWTLVAILWVGIAVAPKVFGAGLC
ncbi:MAG TPA: hypothetical protein VMH36_28790 [Alphaproteobacteria bacterium]|nr:hypothetical protein [Alphaproteobacteria bacterium]